MRLIKRLLNRRSRKDRRAEGSKKEQIISDGQMMKRLLENTDYKRLVEIYKEGAEPLLEKVLSGSHREEREVFIARINQIEDLIKLPSQLIWRMENLPEVIDAKRKKKEKNKPA